MPYVIRNGLGLVETVLENPIDGVTEYLADGSDDLLWFHGKISKLQSLQTVFKSKENTVTIDSIDWDMTGSYSHCFMFELMNAYENAAANVDLCDAYGALHNYLIADAKTLSGQISTYRRELYNNYTSLLNSINATTTIAELDAIDVNAGWPVAP